MTQEKDNLPQWNLNDLFPAPDSKEFASAMDELAKGAAAFQKKYDGKVESLSGDALGAAIAEYEQLDDLSDKIATYAYLLHSTNMLDEKISAFYQNTFDSLTDISSNLIFFGLSINKIEDAALAEKYKSAALAKYKPWIEDVRVSKPYQLSDELEKYSLDKSSTSGSWVRLYDQLNADFKFSFRGEELNSAEIFHKLGDADREVRKQAAEAISKTLGENIRTLTLITNVLAKDKSIDDKWRGFKSPISSRNLANLMEDEVVDSLIKTVKANYAKTAHRYYKWKAKTLGLEKLEHYDRNAPLPEADERYIPYAEAQQIVLDAFGKFSPKAAEIGKKFFDNNWIDVGPRKGKESGAYSHPAAVSVHPYILLNYQGKGNDVQTLAHELGHGIHQYLAREQGALMADTPLTLAETASVFGEQLVFRALLDREQDLKKKKIMIADKIEDMLNTVIRQIAFCEFERQVHDARKNGELSSDDIGKIWMQVQTESLGDAFNFTDDYKVYWSYISHFIHSPFYVYAYACGDCLVNSLYSVYLDGMPDFQSKYLDMLKSGGSKRHKELLAPFGLDATKPDFWQKGLNIIDNFITQLES